jgi:hypothetical protein
VTGHQHRNQSHGANPLRVETPDLNAQAATLAAARSEGDPLVRDLEKIEPRFIAELLRRLDTTDHALIGAVLLTAGDLASQVLELIGPEHRINGGPILTNLWQLAGQQLYQGKMRHITACPYPLATGKPCAHVAKAETEDQLDAVMRGHIDLHHPGAVWPIGEAEHVESAPSGTHEMHLLGWDGPIDHLDITYTPNTPVNPEWGAQIAQAAIAIVTADREYVSPELAEQIRDGIAEAERGETHDLGDFTQYLDDEPEVTD